VLVCAAAFFASVQAGTIGKHAAQARKAAPVPRDGEAEARLIEIYRLIGQARTRTALQKAEALVAEHPNFALAQLVYGDLLTVQARPVRAFGDVPTSALPSGGQALVDLREESQLRMRALRERPPVGAIPAQFLQLSPKNKNAIAIDTSRARLYLFENGPEGLKLIADYYISVGKSGVEKTAEGDLRTPVGVYFITNSLDPKSLKDFYASVESQLIANGRMRRDVAPVDAPYTTGDLVRDFERVALYDEYTDVNGYEYVTGSCLGCHPNDQTNLVDHTRFFPIAKGEVHGDQACGSCHKSTDRSEVDATTLRLRFITVAKSPSR